MKRFTAIFLVFTVVLLFSLAACSGKEEKRETKTPSNRIPQATENGDNRMNNEANIKTSTLVVYFSATGTTKVIAEYAADILNADIYEIAAADPYTEDDLAYYTDGRADREQNDSAARPAISGGVENMQQYDTILLGYPIWHGQAPRIISTFLESYDLSEKTILPFCTSHSSGIGTSDTTLHALAENANWLDGRRFASDTSREDIAAWLDEMAITPTAAAASVKISVFDFETHTVMLNSGYEMPINGLGTYSLHGDECRKSVRSALENGVRLIDTASAYGNEKEIGQAIREAIDDGIIKREELFVITKIYPGEEMANPEASIQTCIDRLDIGYVDMMLLHHPDTNDVKAYSHFSLGFVLKFEGIFYVQAKAYHPAGSIKQPKRAMDIPSKNDRGVSQFSLRKLWVS